jgi:uncharacterized protein
MTITGHSTTRLQTYLNISIYLIYMDYKEILKIWNPWWVYNKVDFSKSKINRSITQELIKFLDVREIIILKGIRRSGKSTVIYQLIDYLLKKGVLSKNIFYFNFDQPLIDSSISSLEDLIKSYWQLNNPKGKVYFFLDEIQNIDFWEKWIKKEFDLREKDVKFIITGSNNSLLSNKLATSLTGRTLSVNIFPLSFQEFLDFNNFVINDIDLDKLKILHYLDVFLKKGGFPEVVLENDSEINKRRLVEYFENILLRDIIILKNISETKKLKDLAYYLITNCSSKITYSKLSQTFGLNKATIKEYISHISQSFLTYEINFYSYSLKNSLSIQKPKKIYNIDNGLREAIAFKFWDDNSKLVENLVFVDLLRRGYLINYWFFKNEVDFVISIKNKLILINVCYTNKIPDREIKGFSDFEKEHKNVIKKIIITNDLEKIENNIHYIPLHKFLLSKKV